MGQIRGVCWFAGAPVWCVQKCPAVRLNQTQRVVGRLLREGGRQESKALLSAPCGTVPLTTANESAEPRGAREAVHRCRLPRDSANARDRSAADTVKAIPKIGSASLRLQTAMLRRESRDCGAVKLLSTQIVRSTGESNHFRRTCKLLAGRRQRFPTVRTAGEVGNGEDEAKNSNFRACTSTGVCKPPWTLRIRFTALLKSGASRQEKASACNRNGATADEHFCYSSFNDGCADVDMTGTENFNSLLHHDGLPAGDDAMAHKVGDGAACRRTGGGVFSIVELHSRVPFCF
jgi:hypothetical protein